MDTWSHQLIFCWVTPVLPRTGTRAAPAMVFSYLYARQFSHELRETWIVDFSENRENTEEINCIVSMQEIISKVLK